ncbi:hypothetical protein GVN20_16820 [Runella sp. CRIBMP]|uniref:hypothetical protein n=1 Tax=Runella sp. CRIBMP TaxID=2683261 RepID=UPI00141310F8|nr:hypothetical protein [Runella sp. CRIBMP]NBB21032.1 hypothetical protein [Runella sp. CRIBMP]
MKKMQLSSLFTLFFCLFLFTSCENKQESINLDEKEQILKLLKSHGFTEQPFSGAGRISTMGEFSERKKIRTLEDAKNFIKIFESFNEGTIKIDLNQIQNKNLRSSFVACDDQGTYYVNRAVEGLMSTIDITFQRDELGKIFNVTSMVHGIPFYGYSQDNFTIFGDKRQDFCIDGTMVWGLDIAGLPLAARPQVYLRVHLYGPESCQAQVSWGYGHC